MNQLKINELKSEIKKLGKSVAESKSTTQFPEWIHFKIGISTLEGIPFENEFWEKRIQPGLENSIN